MMAENSSRLGLPFLVTGQGQKDVTLNEALQALDCLVGASAVSRVISAPPTFPGAGLCWLVPGGATGAWAGRGGMLACWTEGGWRYRLLPEGFTLWVEDEAREIRRVGGAWREVAGTGSAAAAVPVPSGGQVADVEVRQAVSALIDRLVQLGLLSS